MDLHKLDSLKHKLDSLRPLPEHTMKCLYDQIVLEWTYNSIAIEGNTLTLQETKVVLEGVTVGGKSIIEHLEAINHKHAIEYLQELIGNDEPFCQRIIKLLHQLVLKGFDNENAGGYRNQNVLITGAQHIPPEPFKLDQLMENLVNWYHECEDHPIIRAAILHCDFVNIHPFIDGNGRTARLLMNFELIRSGHLPVVIKAANRLEYYQALDKAATTKDYQDFIDIIIQAELETLERHLYLIP